jgi:2-phosphoglycerate kinase
MSGKSTLAEIISRKQGMATISIDDLTAAIRAVTTTSSHPALYPMDGQDYREYYLDHSPAQLIEHAEAEHLAAWPAIEAVISAHAKWGRPAVIEGWQMDASHVARLRLENVKSLWLVADQRVLEQRLREDRDFHTGASDSERLIQQFMLRSAWHNSKISSEAQRLNLPVLRVSGNESSETLAAMAEALLR